MKVVFPVIIIAPFSTPEMAGFEPVVTVVFVLGYEVSGNVEIQGALILLPSAILCSLALLLPI